MLRCGPYLLKIVENDFRKCQSQNLWCAHKGGAMGNVKPIGVWRAIARNGGSILVCVLTMLPGPVTLAAEDRISEMEHIVVTAEKRDKDLQSAAMVGTVFNDELLRRSMVDEIDDLEFATPSLTIATAGQSNQMNLRGIGKFDSGGTSTSAVATYRDGVGTVSGFFNQEPYYDLASVEVLRGPQGTFVGENAAAGAIFVNTRNPVLGQGYSGYVEAGAGDYGAFELTGAVNVPLADTLAVRVAARHTQRDSFFDVYMDPAATIRNPGNPGELDYDSVRVGVLWQPTEPLSMLFKVDVNRLDHGGHVFGNVPGFPTPVGAITGQPFGNISDDLYTVGNNFAGALAKDEMNRYIFDLDYEFAGGTQFRWVSGYQDIDTRIRNDDDGSVDADLRIHIRPLFEVTTTEGTLISPEDQQFRWLVGAFYRREELRFPQDDGFITFTGPDPAVEGLRILWDTVRRTDAVYGQIAFDLTPELELEAGLRWQQYDSSQDADILFFGTSLLRRIDSYDEDNISYKVALNWQMTDAHYFYGFVATGNTTGGSSVVLGVPSFTNQESTTFEAGWKGTLLDGQITTQLGGFYTIIDDYQATFSAVIDATTVPPLLSTTFQNLDGDTKTRGIELQVQSQFDRLGLDFNLALIDSELGDDLIFDTTLARFIETGGNRIPWSPTHTFNVGLQYDFPLGNGSMLTPRITYSKIGEQMVTATDRVIGGIPVDRIFAHDLVNLQVNWTKDVWRVQAYVSNALEEEYIQAHSGDGAHPDAYANEPRRFGIRVTRHFDP